MKTTLVDSILDAVDTTPAADRLDAIHGKVAELREGELEKSRLEDELRTVNIRIREILWEELPTMMDEALVPAVTIAAQGNKPAYSVKVKDYYHGLYAGGTT